MDLDGWVDLYVANDVSHNAVFHNADDGTFTDIGAQSLAADYRGAMGLGADDVDHDGDLDLFVTHWLAQENGFYVNMLYRANAPTQSRPAGNLVDHVLFFDYADKFGLGQSSLDVVGWATGFVDLDNDGWSDLWVVIGSTLEQRDDHRQLDPQPMPLYHHRPGKGFFEATEQACPILQQPFVGRGEGVSFAPAGAV